MAYNPQIHHRRSIRLKGYDYSQPGAYFITLCTQNREWLFGEIRDNEMVLNEYGQIAEQCWTDLPNHYPDVHLDEFVIMPNHFHGIVIIVGADNIVGAIHESPQPESPQPVLSKLIGRFKMNSAKKINQIRNTRGIPVWQRNYYEHIIRNEISLENIRNYIMNNPSKWFEDENNI